MECFVVALQGHQVLVGNAVFLSNGCQGVLLRHLQGRRSIAALGERGIDI